MGNTANNNWPYPESTDLVKDGATAIENLADAIDTTLGVYSAATPGLVHITQVDTGGAVSSVNLDNIFSADYTQYRIITNGVFASSGVLFTARLRVGGVDNSSSVYFRQNFTVTGTSVTGARTSSATSWANLCGLGGFNLNITEIYNPFQTKNTTARSYNGFSGDGASIEYRDNYYGVSVTTSYTGLSLTTNTGTFNGTFDVYGCIT
jgi:hypothetical protein